MASHLLSQPWKGINKGRFRMPRAGLGEKGDAPLLQNPLCTDIEGINPGKRCFTMCTQSYRPIIKQFAGKRGDSRWQRGPGGAGNSTPAAGAAMGRRHEALRRAGGNSSKSLLGLNMLFKHTGGAAKGGFGERVVPDGWDGTLKGAVLFKDRLHSVLAKSDAPPSRSGQS